MVPYICLRAFRCISCETYMLVSRVYFDVLLQLLVLIISYHSVASYSHLVACLESLYYRSYGHLPSPQGRIVEVI